ncbi:MAG: hypothetical protein AB8B83_02990 [Bdellovibrionales bacterium]
MFNTINNIFGTKPRQAEQNDTRQDIQRHDPEFERRRRKKKQNNEDLMPEDGGANVSIDALEIFLNKFLKELSEKSIKSFNATSDSDENKALKENNPPKPEHLSGSAAQAAQAYQHSAESQHSHSLLGDITESNADLISLEASEIRTIHALLGDLKLLKNKNIEYIHIERAESFLNSLVNAVNTVKSAPSFKA